MVSRKCPYCKKAPDKPIKRKTKCPHCGEHILVRGGKLVTEDDAKVDDWITKRLEKYGITIRDYHRERKALKKNSRKNLRSMMSFGAY